MIVDNVVFSGGGFSGFYILGALEAVGPHLGERLNAYGSSAGSIVACIAAMRADPRKALERAVQRSSVRERGLLNGSLARLVMEFGLDNGEVLLGEIKDVLIEAWGSPRGPTFGELREEKGSSLHVVVTSVCKGGAEIYGPDTTPDASVFDAVCMSCRVPLILTPGTEHGDFKVDGGLSNYFPSDLVNDNMNSVGVCVTYTNRRAPTTSLPEYFLLLLQATLRIDLNVPWALYLASDGQVFLGDGDVRPDGMRELYSRGKADMTKKVAGLSKKYA